LPIPDASGGKHNRRDDEQRAFLPAAPVGFDDRGEIGFREFHDVATE
jgi:hypothetical protein